VLAAGDEDGVYSICWVEDVLAAGDEDGVYSICEVELVVRVGMEVVYPIAEVVVE
jgi:hypothetical protein